jgi:hypothetical protein
VGFWFSYIPQATPFLLSSSCFYVFVPGFLINSLSVQVARKMAPSIDYPAPLPLSLSSLSNSIPQKQATINVSVIEIIEDDASQDQFQQDSLSPHSQEPIDPLNTERQRLRNHLGLPTEQGAPVPEQPRIQPLFFIERVPDSRAVSCSLPGCTHGSLQPGELRLALNPGMGGDMWFRSSSGPSRLLPQLTTIYLHLGIGKSY